MEENEVIDNEVVIDDLEDTQNFDEVEEWELTVDDYNKLKREHEKAIKKLVELKKQTKTQPKKEENVLTEEKLALREEVADFLLENKDLKEYKSDLLKYREQWFTLKQAVALVEADDKTIENRKKLQSMNITSWESSTKKDTYTQAEVAKMPLEQRAKFYEWVKSGKYKVTM